MLTISIQAGGQSSRMGQDKALMPFLGRPLIERILQRLAPVADEVIITTNRPQAYAFLNLPLFADILPGRGALGGLYTALASASHPLVALAACDMPFASPELIAFEREILLAEKADVVIPGGPDGFLEPLHALFRRETCLPPVEQALADGRWKMISWLNQVNVRILRPEELQPFNRAGLTFWNLNTPEEFAHAERLAGGPTSLSA